jgi:molecular chaperone DnaJ
MSKTDYYEILGVAKDVETSELKKSYRLLAMKFHPDRNPDNPEAEAKFKEAAEAYEVLSDTEKRQIYDRFGHEGLSGRAGGGGAGFGNVEDIFSQFGDIFGDFFGFRQQASPDAARRGADMRLDIELSFEEAVFGVTKEVEVPRHAECETCEGSGAKPGTEPITCIACAGRGQVHHAQGFFTLTSSCPTCRGAGKVISDPCGACKGMGVTEEVKTVSVKVPGGVDDGTRLRMRSEGESGRRGGPRGDLYVFLHVRPSDTFQRDGSDLHLKVELAFVQAALGCSLEIPTLDGRTNIEVKAGTQFGDTSILRGQGVPKVNRGGKGDLIVHFAILTPKKLDAKQRELLEEYAKVSGIPTKEASFFDRLKEKIT